MNARKIVNDTFYTLKPLIPRQLQLWIRSKIIQVSLKSYADSWPILESAASPPPEWQGWPDNKKFGLVLMHDIETALGQSRCTALMELEQRYGVCSAFNFVPERYEVSESLRHELVENGFEVAVHGLNHDRKLYRSQSTFDARAKKINQYIKDWGASGFCSPASHHVLEWNYALNIEYDSSTFDTDPFEAQPDNVNTIFPFWVSPAEYPNEDYMDHPGYLELPYTLAQDFYLLILMKHQNADVWKRKLDWIVEKGGMALLITHPDYMYFGEGKQGFQEYPLRVYEEFLDYVVTEYDGQYWHGLPKELTAYCKKSIMQAETEVQHA